MSFVVGDLVRVVELDARGELIGKLERVGRYQGRVVFRRLPWTPPTVTLPEMREFPLDQLEPCRSPWSDLAKRRWSPVDEVRLRVRCAELWLGNAQGQLGNARTDLLPHQVCLVQEVLERKRRRLLIAEEVGMGKTIETGMIIHALAQRRELERCLVVCPAGQIAQWQEELEEKLRVRFEIYRQDIDGLRAFSYPKVIASLDTLKLDAPSERLRGKSHLQILLEAPAWDLVVFDEAHRLTARDYGAKVHKTLNYRLAEELSGRTRDFILLTGTPHDGSDSKFRNLLKALEPQVCFTRQQPGVFFGTLILKNRKSEARAADGELLFRRVAVEKVSLPALASGEAQFHTALTAYLREGYGVAEQDPTDPKNRALGFVMITFQKLASSSASAVRGALAKRLKRLKAQNSARPVKPPASELDADDRFAGEVEEMSAEELQATLLRDAFMASEIEMLKELVGYPLPDEAKWVELCRLTEAGLAKNPTEKFLIFTEYRGTVAFLKNMLINLHGEHCLETIMGGMTTDARRTAMQRFREDSSCRFLISTEAGGEGVNLQFCNIVVNYDLPWNPFRVIQRVGRVHRIGQKRDMQVFNYRLHSEIDERLSNCHDLRVDTAVARLSEVTGLDATDIRDQLLGFAQEFIDYDKIFGQAQANPGSRSSEEQITEGLKRAEAAFQLAYDTVFKHAIAPFNPERFKKILGVALSLDDLREWLDGWLKAHGRRLMQRSEECTYEFLLPESLKHRVPLDQRSVRGTFDRAKAIRESSVSLLAFGNPTIDMIAREAMTADAGGFVAKVRFPDSDDTDVLAVALLQTETHAGASAHQLLYIAKDKVGNWSIISPGILNRVSANTNSLIDHSAGGLRIELEEFVQTCFPDLDFASEHLHFIAILVR